MLGVQVFKYVEQTETLYCSKSNYNKFLQKVGSHCYLLRFDYIVSTRENALLISKIVILDSEPLHQTSLLPAQLAFCSTAICSSVWNLMTTAYLRILMSLTVKVGVVMSVNSITNHLPDNQHTVEVHNLTSFISNFIHTAVTVGYLTNSEWTKSVQKKAPSKASKQCKQTIEQRNYTINHLFGRGHYSTD